MALKSNSLKTDKSQIKSLNTYRSYDDQATSLLDYLPKNGVMIIDELSRVQEMNDSLVKEEAEWYTSLLSEGQIIHDVMISHDFPV